MKRKKRSLLLSSLALAFLLSGGLISFSDSNQALAQGGTAVCNCTFWGTCKLGAGRAFCKSYKGLEGGNCTSENRNCRLFSPGG